MKIPFLSSFRSSEFRSVVRFSLKNLVPKIFNLLALSVRNCKGKNGRDRGGGGRHDLGHGCSMKYKQWMFEKGRELYSVFKSFKLLHVSRIQHRAVLRYYGSETDDHCTKNRLFRLNGWSYVMIRRLENIIEYMSVST